MNIILKILDYLINYDKDRFIENIVCLSPLKECIGIPSVVGAFVVDTFIPCGQCQLCQTNLNNKLKEIKGN